MMFCIFVNKHIVASHNYIIDSIEKLLNFQMHSVISNDLFRPNTNTEIVLDKKKRQKKETIKLIQNFEYEYSMKLSYHQILLLL